MEVWVSAIAFFIVLIFAATRTGQALFSRARCHLRALGDRPWAAALLLASISIILNAIPAIWHVPAPIVHDEFAYLLEGDTFAQGRLANPPHPMARYFETFHVLQSPTYMAKFPPATGLFLSIGDRIGLPIAGMWLAGALGAMAIFWMLRAILPARWALLLAAISICNPTIIWFNQTYWGGGVALIGGAFAGGALLRTMRDPISRWGFIGGAGVALLAISRPFEGLLLCTISAIVLFVVSVKRAQLRAVLVRVAPAFLLFPMLTIAWIGYDNYRVTGQVTQMPYALHTQRYMAAPLFFWQDIPPLPTYPNAQMAEFHGTTELAEYSSEVGWPNFPISLLNRGGMIVWAYFRPMLLLIPLLVALIALRKRLAVRSAAIICVGVVLLHMLICPWMRVAYMSMLFGMTLVLVGFGLRKIDRWQWRGERLGRTLVPALVAAQITAGLFALIYLNWANSKSVFAQRQHIVDSLTSQGGQHLVLVHYGPGHSPSAEWVYNAADIDHSPIVFARDLGAEQNYDLLSYFANRKVWQLDITNRQVDLHPFSDRAPVLNPLANANDDSK